MGMTTHDRRGTTWHDVALSIAAELMDKIRAEVRTQLEYTTSAVRIITCCSPEHARAF
jgi:DNA polymerase eta